MDHRWTGSAEEGLQTTGGVKWHQTCSVLGVSLKLHYVPFTKVSVSIFVKTVFMLRQ